MSVNRPTQRRRLVLAALGAVSALVLASCGSDGTTASGESPDPGGAPSDEQASPVDEASGDEDAEAGSGGCGTTVAFDPERFVDPTLDTNPYHPLRPGIQWVRGGTTLVGDREVPHEINTTMTDVIRVIDGAPTVAMLDESTDSGEVSQVGMDYMALDVDGNVWILGGYTEEYEGGEYTNTESAWLGAQGGQTIGILAPAEVTMDTPRWCIGGAADEDPSVGEPVEVGASVCVEFGCYDEVRVVQEGEVGAPDNEHKYYAPGVGVINNVPLDASLHQDRFELLNLVELSTEGLAEASRTVIDLEAHAHDTAPDIYEGTPESTRADG
jgi:hypothetical protein